MKLSQILKNKSRFFTLFYAHPLLVGLGFFFFLFVFKIFIIRWFFDGKIYFRQWHTDNEGELLLSIMAYCIAITVQQHKDDDDQEAFYKKTWWFLLLYVIALAIFGGALTGDVLRGERTFASVLAIPSEWVHAFFIMPTAFALLLGSLPLLWRYREERSAKYGMGSFVGFLGLLGIDNFPALTPRDFVQP